MMRILKVLFRQLLSAPGTNRFPDDPRAEVRQGVPGEGCRRPQHRDTAGAGAAPIQGQDCLRQGEVHRLPALHQGMPGQGHRVHSRRQEGAHLRESVLLLLAVQRNLPGELSFDDRTSSFCSSYDKYSDEMIVTGKKA